MSIISISPYQWPCNRNLTWRYLPYWSGHVRPMFQAYIPTIHMVPKKIWYVYVPKKIRSGKRLHNYGKIHHFQWVNPLFRLGHGFKFANWNRHYQRVGSNPSHPHVPISPCPAFDLVKFSHGQHPSLLQSQSIGRQIHPHRSDLAQRCAAAVKRRISLGVRSSANEHVISPKYGCF